jgi:hypothetical protein
MATATLPQTSLFPFDITLPPNEQTSLSSKAMLCTVSISAWSGYKFDREASEEIAEIHGAEKDSSRFNKRPMFQQSSFLPYSPGNWCSDKA